MARESDFCISHYCKVFLHPWFKRVVVSIEEETMSALSSHPLFSIWIISPAEQSRFAITSTYQYESQYHNHCITTWICMIWFTSPARQSWFAKKEKPSLPKLTQLSFSIHSCYWISSLLLPIQRSPIKTCLPNIPKCSANIICRTVMLYAAYVSWKGTLWLHAHSILSYVLYYAAYALQCM